MLTTGPACSYYVLMSTPAAVEPSNPRGGRHDAWSGEKKKLAKPHPLDAAAVAVRELSPQMRFEQARTFAQKAPHGSDGIITLGFSIDESAGFTAGDTIVARLSLLVC